MEGKWSGIFAGSQKADCRQVCGQVPLAVRRYDFYVDCVEYITLLPGMGRRADT